MECGHPQLGELNRAKKVELDRVARREKKAPGLIVWFAVAMAVALIGLTVVINWICRGG